MVVLLAVLAVLAVVALAVAVVAVVWSRAPRRWVDSVERSEVLVHTRSATYRGLLAGVYPDGLLLAAAEHVDGAVKLAGDVFIPRGEVYMIQRGGDLE